MLFDFRQASSSRAVVKIPKGYLGKVRLWSFRSNVNFQFLNAVINDALYVEGHKLDRSLAKCRRPHGPVWGEPTCGAFHAHAELRQPTAIRWYLSWPERPVEVCLVNSPGIVSDHDAPIVLRINLNGDLKLETIAVQPPELLLAVKEALNGVVDEFSEREPGLIP